MLPPRLFVAPFAVFTFVVIVPRFVKFVLVVIVVQIADTFDCVLSAGHGRERHLIVVDSDSITARGAIDGFDRADRIRNREDYGTRSVDELKHDSIHLNLIFIY